MLTKPIDGKPATVLNGGTIGFQMKDAAQGEAWHKAGVANGGAAIRKHCVGHCWKLVIVGNLEIGPPDPADGARLRGRVRTRSRVFGLPASRG